MLCPCFVRWNVMEPNRYVTTHLHFMLNKIHWFYFKKWKSNWQWSTRNVMWYSLNVLFQQQPAAALPESSFQLFMSIWIFLLFHIFLCWLLVLPFQDETNGLQHQYFFRIHVVILKMKNRSIWFRIFSRPCICIRIYIVHIRIFILFL